MGAAFADAMRQLTEFELAGIVRAYPWPRRGVICDIAGGVGHMLAAILDHRPHARGILLDSPRRCPRCDARPSADLTTVHEGIGELQSRCVGASSPSPCPGSSRPIARRCRPPPHSCSCRPSKDAQSGRCVSGRSRCLCPQPGRVLSARDYALDACAGCQWPHLGDPASLYELSTPRAADRNRSHRADLWPLQRPESTVYLRAVCEDRSQQAGQSP